MKLKLSNAEIRLLVKLEKKYKLLSGDMIGQDELFEMQDMLMQGMVKGANAANNDTMTEHLQKEMPYMFATSKI